MDSKLYQHSLKGARPNAVVPSSYDGTCIRIQRVRRLNLANWSFKFPDRGRPKSYSITLSARTRIELGIVMPSALAVFMLMASSNLVGC